MLKPELRVFKHNEGKKEVEWKSIVKGDLIEFEDTPGTIYLATSNSFLNEEGIWTVEIDSVPRS